MALEAINNALKKLTKTLPTVNSDEEDSTVIQDVFCFEDTLMTKDLKVTIRDVGEVPAPIPEDFIKKIINVSSKAKFGKGERTVLDTKVRDTQVVPACDLDVEIDKYCLENLLTRAKSGLNITQSCTLVPHLHNMLVYGPGQFFKMHKDSEKVPNMVATLVFLLPSFHKGGDLVIQHNNSNHFFFGSQNHNLIKCIIFYSDCLHEIRPVSEGYRVAITYNIVLEPVDETGDVHVDDFLDDAVKGYFSSDTGKPEKLMYALNHEYSETNLKWGLLKGQDRTQAFALLAVAKKQNLVPCLALGSLYQTFQVGCEDEDPDEEEVTLDHFVDEWNVKFTENDVIVHDEELCYSSKTEDIFKPYETEESGPTGNEGMTVEHRYRRGFVVLWSSKWNFSHGYKECLRELHRSVTTRDGKEAVSLEAIHKIKSNVIQVKYWKDPEVIKYLIDIVVHLNDKKIAVSFLSNMQKQLTQLDRIDLLLKLEDQYDDETWSEILKDWSFEKRSYNDQLPSFFEEYLKHPSRKPKSFIIKFLSEKHVQQFLYGDRDRQYLVDIVLYLNDRGLAVIILSKLFDQIIQPDKVDKVLKLENQLDDETWLSILEDWTKQNCEFSKVPVFVDAYIKQKPNHTNSSFIKFISEKCIQKFMDTNKDYQISADYEFSFNDQYLCKRADNLWTMLKMCFDLGNVNLENKLIQHIIKNPSSFQPKTVFKLLVLLKSKVHPAKFSSYKCLKDSAFKCIQTKLAQFNKGAFWEIQKGFNCTKHQCETCPHTRNFLRAKDIKKYCLAANANVRKHTTNMLKSLEQAHYLVFSTDNTKRPSVLIVEKDDRVYQENRSQVARIEKLQSKFEQITFPQVEENFAENALGTPPAINEKSKREEPLNVEEPSTKRVKSE